jgi:F-type H+-transporting ATPase subunit delta
LSQIVADRYAEALFDLAVEGGLVEKVDTELTLITQTLAENQELRGLLFHPLVAREDKKAVALKIFSAYLQPVMLNFLQLLFDKNRGNIIDLIQSRFHHLASKLQKRLVLQVTTASVVPPEDIEHFRERLEREWSMRLDIEQQVDPDVLGGARLKVEDQVIDGTLRGALDKLRREMLNS